ncbi:hypothetical protein SSX86_015212 [Deinandra increscens subsp. villosa]|uniref:WRC domain-containing protein n=1 Tax=Deinandra increscens subsp. villosa TaxID=3103831 RepID=A0AAP0D117_9ASTR
MRIRKRFLSLSTPIDLPGGNNNSVTAVKINPSLHPQSLLSSSLRVQHREELHPNNGNQHVGGSHSTGSQFPDPPNQCHRPLPPSSSTQIGLQPSTRASSGDCSHPKKTKIFKEMESERKKESFKTDDDDKGCRKESILCAEANNNHDLGMCSKFLFLRCMYVPMCVSVVLKGWFQGDKLIPVKKKRGSNMRRLNNDVVQDNEMIDEPKKPKLKKNDKLVTMGSKMNTKKNETREGVIMEGSRCSRVNGRGWRCSQQTLIGYSLCDHHLGKGRVRSMSSVRGGARMVAPKEHQRKAKRVKSKLIDHDEIEYEDDGEGEEFKDWDVESMSSMEGTKVFSKKTKVGVVKARSLSSLLSQISS